MLLHALLLGVIAETPAPLQLAQPTNLSEAIACLRSPPADLLAAEAGEVGMLVGALCARGDRAARKAAQLSSSFLQLRQENSPRGRSAAGYLSWQHTRNCTGSAPRARRGMAVALEGAGAGGERMWLYGGCDASDAGQGGCSSEIHSLGLDTMVRPACQCT